MATRFKLFISAFNWYVRIKKYFIITHMAPTFYIRLILVHLDCLSVPDHLFSNTTLTLRPHVRHQFTISVWYEVESKQNGVVRAVHSHNVCVECSYGSTSQTFMWLNQSNAIVGLNRRYSVGASIDIVLERFNQILCQYCSNGSLFFLF